MTAKILDQHIEITPGITGGKPHIAGHRITVQDIVIWHEWMGRNADEIANEYDLELADVYAALTYYYDHINEINESIRKSRTFVESIRQMTPSKIVKKLHECKN
ncbi:MAG: DUF433 domain-containing protein [bacterium]